jgi:hypothetical protein
MLSTNELTNRSVYFVIGKDEPTIGWFNLHKVLADELTTDQFETDENELTDISVQNQNKETDADVLRISSFKTDDRSIDELTTDQFMNAGKRIQVNLLQISSHIQIQCKLNLLTDRFNLHGMWADELTTDQFGD